MSGRGPTLMRGFLTVALIALELAPIWPTSAQVLTSPTHGIPVSFDIHRLPHRQDVRLIPLTRRDLTKLSPTLATKGGIKRAAGDALAAARKEFGIGLNRIDRHVGIVAAVVDPVLHPMLGHIPAWVITADVETRGTNRYTADIVYRRLCIVVSIRTARYRYAYVADPHGAHQATR
jgi:hypothetical protein